MELCLREQDAQGIPNHKLKSALEEMFQQHPAKKVLILPPDYTRLYSNAGFITAVAYDYYTQKGAQVDVLPALGTHVPMTQAQVEHMFCGRVPFEKVIPHHWRTDVVKLGEVPSAYLSQITEGLWNEPVQVEINRRVLDKSYDLILSPGQVVPHEVVGMANHSKNLFVGVGGSDMINKSHMVGAVYGMERMMGRDNTPVRKIFDYALTHFLADAPLLFVLTVTTAPDNQIHTHGVFAGRERDVLEAAVALAQQTNLDYLDKPIQKCVVYLDPAEFQSTWLGNKAVYRTRMAMADGGELLVLAPAVERFGEDPQVDALIRKYGYCGRLKVLELFQQPENTDLQQNMGAAAHLIHGSSDGRFTITYAVRDISQAEIQGVHFQAADYEETIQRYDPQKLSYGWNTMEDGEEIFYVPNPALGLWIDKTRFIP